MNHSQLKDVFWTMVADSVGTALANPDQFIRFKYPPQGQPDWKITQDILFLNLSEKDDAYGKQNNSIYQTIGGTVKRVVARTRVWSLLITTYGPNSYDLSNLVKDKVFTQKIHDYLSKNNVFLIPNLPICVQAPELYAGQWWDRWDLTLNFNELYLPEPDDVGHIDSITISTTANRR